MNKRIAAVVASVFLSVFLCGCGTSLQPSSQTAGSDVNQPQNHSNVTEPATDNQGGLIPATVTRVVDGDTIEVDLNGAAEKVRLIGVDTPETVHPTLGQEPYGKEASDYTRQKLTGKTVELEMDVQERDQYGRLLAYVWIDNELFNEVLVSSGYAQVATYPPNIKYVDRFTAAQKQARDSRLGLWTSEEEQKSPLAGMQGKYVGSVNSNKYHSPGCKWAQQIQPENQIWFKTRQEAEAAGYVPCKACKP